MDDANDKSKYVSLAPRDDKRKEYEEYHNALDFAMKDKGIRNIAITGSYGTGKSSVIDSYFNNHKEIKCIRISLAYFNFTRAQKKQDDEIDKDLNEIDKDLNENDIEAEVLKNLFYSIDGRKLKRNKFLTVKSKKEIKDYIVQGIFAFSLIITVVLLKLSFNIIDKMFNTDDMEYIKGLIHRISNIYVISLLFFSLLVIVIFISCIVVNYDNLLPYIKTIIFKNAKIDISNESIINQYLHEIMSFMIDVEESVFIFEDLDRYESYSIFEKLRNLCILINNNEIIKNKFKYRYNVSCIKFIYAIKDDFVFTNKESNNLLEERTKFFDFVIPIIPKITQSNVIDVLVENRKRLQLNDITDDYIFVISVYLTNLRMINNIFNEFQVYKKAIGNNNNAFDNRQLLTLMIFKNLYPKKFIEYQRSNLFNKMIIDIKDKKKSLLKHYKDIFAEYDVKAVVNINSLNGQQQIEYKNAKRMIDIIEKDRMEIYDENEIKDVFNQCGNNQFLITAIRNGYINDAVSYYINYFYPDFIDNNDKEFLMNLYAGYDTTLDYKLHNVERIYNRLPEVYFSNKLIINYDLMKYAICEKYNDKKTEMLSRLIMDKNLLLFDLIKHFENSDSNVNEKLIAKCKSIDEEYFVSLMLDDNVDASNKLFVLDKLLLYLNEEDIHEMDKDQALSDVVNDNIDMIYDRNENLQELYVKKLNIRCENVKYNKESNNQGNFANMLIMDKVGNEECFVYKELLKIYYLYKGKFNVDFENDNLKFIHNAGESNVIDNINVFPDEYVEKCLLNTNIESITIDDKLVELLYLLKNEDNVKNVIKGLKGKIDIQVADYNGKIITDDNEEIIEFLDKRKKLIYAELLKNVNISLTMNDLYKCFSDLGWGQPLTKYISDNLNELLNHSIEIENKDEKVLKFYKSMILNCKSIDNIEELLGNNRISLQHTELASLPQNLIEKLLQGNNIEYDVNCMVVLSTRGFKGIEWYIYYNINDFMNNNQFNLLSEDILTRIIDIFNNNKEKTNVDNDNINTMLTNICLLINKKYTQTANFSVDGIISKFIISSQYDFNYNILNRVLLNKDLDLKIEILCNRLEQISKENIVGIIKSNNSPFYDFLDNNTQVYTINKENFQKSFSKVKKLVNYIAKKQIAEKIENQDTNVIMFKLL